MILIFNSLSYLHKRFDINFAKENFVLGATRPHGVYLYGLHLVDHFDNCNFYR